MAIEFRHRRGTVAENNAFTGASAEVVVDTTNNRLRVHDGVTTGGFPVGDFVNVLDFGAVGDGVTDDTLAFEAAKDSLQNGGEILVPPGTYMLTDFIIDKKNILLKGVDTGLNYDDTGTQSTVLTNSTTATFVVRLPYTYGDVSSSAAAYSGLANLTVSGNSEYGVFIDCGSTILDGVHVQGFNYGCVIADAANNNVFNSCAFTGATYVGFAVTEVNGKSYLHPNVTISSNVSSTSFFMNKCLFRQNEWGVILRTGINFQFNNCTFESNTQAGLYIYRTDNSTIRLGTFNNCWFENNYDGYVAGVSSYTITDNNMFKINNANTYISWTDPTDVGYQLLIDSQTKGGGGAGDTLTFTSTTIAAPSSTDQLGLYLRSGIKMSFKDTWISGGVITNFIKISSDAIATYFENGITQNDPTQVVNAFIDSLINNSTTTVIKRLETSSADLTLDMGSYRGPIKLDQGSSTDSRTLDDYDERANSLTWRVGGASPFSVSNEDVNIIKIGRVVHVRAKAILTATGTTAGNDKLYVTGLPFSSNLTGQISGQCWIQASGGGASVLNNGISPLYTLTPTDKYGILDNFSAIAVGHVYTVSFEATYTTDT